MEEEMKDTCIHCKFPIRERAECISWTDSRPKEPKEIKEEARQAKNESREFIPKEYETYLIHLSCFNHKNYGGLHQNIEPGTLD